MYDLEYTFGFSLPVMVGNFCLGELEDMEAVACIIIDEDGESWYVDEFQIRDLPDPENRTTGTLYLSPHDWDWITQAVKDEFKRQKHAIEIDRMVRGQRDDDEPSWAERERAIHHRSVL